MRRFGVLFLALGLTACAAGGAPRAQSWGYPYGSGYSYPAYGYSHPNYGWNTRPQPRDPSTALRGEGQAALEAEVLAEINRVRTNPEHYARKLRAFRAYYHGDVVQGPGDPVGMRTHEGVAALEEAIADLERRAPLRALEPSSRLAASAARLTEGEGRTGAVGHIGPDGSTPGKRIRAEGVWAGITEENISYGQSTAEAVVRQLVIDDGVPSRGHRAAIFERGLSVAGVSCGPHVRWGYMCVIDFAGALAQR